MICILLYNDKLIKCDTGKKKSVFLLKVIYYKNTHILRTQYSYNVYPFFMK